MRSHGRVSALFCFVLAAGASRAAPAQLITEFRIPGGTVTTPLGIVPVPGGMRFTCKFSRQIGAITPDGTVSLVRVSRPPSAIVNGPSGDVWFTSPQYVSHLESNGTQTDFQTSRFSWGDNPSAITYGPDGALWFTDADEEGGRIGRLTTEGGVVSEYIKSPEAENPSAIRFGPDGKLWVTVYGTDAGSTIDRIDPLGGVGTGPGGAFVEFRLSGFRGITAITYGPDGNLWFTERDANMVGRVTPLGRITEFAVSGNPRGITSGGDGNLWFTEETGNRIGRITPDGVVAEFPIPTPNSVPWGIAAGDNGTIWFTESGAGRIGKLTVTPVACGPSTLCLGGNRYEVSAVWQTADGQSGVAHPVALGADSGYFWFFDSDAPELIVKMVDGCSLNGHQWFFAAGLTNVQVDLIVGDTRSGETKIYASPQGTPFPSVLDTGSLAGCSQSVALGRSK
jgi:streptogramin lyase